MQIKLIEYTENTHYKIHTHSHYTYTFKKTVCLQFVQQQKIAGLKKKIGGKVHGSYKVVWKSDLSAAELR